MMDTGAADPIKVETMKRIYRCVFCLMTIADISVSGCGRAAAPERKVRTIVLKKGNNKGGGKTVLKSWRERTQ